MCWDWSDCGYCDKRTMCPGSCGCSDDEECKALGHRDCKSFTPCSTCYQDLCDRCADKYGQCYSCITKYGQPSEGSEEEELN